MTRLMNLNMDLMNSLNLDSWSISDSMSDSTNVILSRQNSSFILDSQFCKKEVNAS